MISSILLIITVEPALSSRLISPGLCPAGKSGDVMKTDHFNMYSGSVEPLIEFLKDIEAGSVVLMAVFDEGSTKLNEEARTLISDLGSSTIHSLGYRDNWVFVGGKGTTGKKLANKEHDKWTDWNYNLKNLTRNKENMRV
uniref:ILEI/PANDER domain-containing protein n=1 Tax=Poecilia reticulata TaxID=8081 RepID=A0A3P9QA13_POERE